MVLIYELFYLFTSKRFDYQETRPTRTTTRQQDLQQHTKSKGSVRKNINGDSLQPLSIYQYNGKGDQQSDIIHLHLEL
jgi:hypothetical protein